MTRGAVVVSGDAIYRYALWRELRDSLDSIENEGTCLFVMLNPSTADASIDDPTIRRCKRFAREWGFARLSVVNLYALRATHPIQLTEFKGDAVGPKNDEWIRRLANAADRVVAAWGGHDAVHARVDRVRELLPSETVCLGTTVDGQPRHPLFVRADAAVIPWSAA